MSDYDDDKVPLLSIDTPHQCVLFWFVRREAQMGIRRGWLALVAMLLVLVACAAEELEPEPLDLDEVKQGLSCGISLSDNNLNYVGSPTYTQVNFSAPKALANLPHPTSVSGTTTTNCEGYAELVWLTSGQMARTCRYYKSLNGQFGSATCSSGLGVNNPITGLRFETFITAGACGGGVLRFFGATAVVQENYTSYACRNDVCGANGVTSTMRPAGTQCAAATSCRNAGTCNGASLNCQTGAPRASGTVCLAATSCTNASLCNGSGSCIAGAHRPANTSCSDGLACNGTEACNGSGTCVNTPLPPGVNPCDDENPCNGVESCGPGFQCVNGTAPPTGTECGPGTACRAPSTCGSNGTCEVAPLHPVGTECGSATACRAAPTCTAAGECPIGTAFPANTVCEEGTSCTEPRLCNGSGTCLAAVHKPVDTACSDGLICNGSEACDGAGSCVNTPLQPGANPCDDGNPCNGVETCGLDGQCAPGEPLALGAQCAEATACRAASFCGVNGGCDVGEPFQAGVSCSDGNACNGEEKCNGNGSCVAGTNLAQGTLCSDEDACNGEEKCNGNGSCVAGTPISATEVDDHNECTTDSCDPARGIVNELIAGCGVPPNLSTPAPGESPSYAAGVEFLYTGANPVQTGVSPSTIEPKRSAVIRGRVARAMGADVDIVAGEPGVLVRVLDHPEYGQTLTRADGYYDLVVNGGGSFVLDFAKAGALPVQRRASTQWNEWTVLDDVVLTEAITSADPFEQGSLDWQLVQGANTPNGEDSDNERRADLFFAPDTHASGTLDSVLSVDITEYTRGSRGPQRMPGELPGTSGYTYAVELGLRDAAGQPVEDVTFDKPVTLYVSNFTGYPVGEPVPVGFYDRTARFWRGTESGRIIKVHSIDNGLAKIDMDSGITGGDAGPEEFEELEEELGFTAEELEALASYPVGTELWRVQMSHFSAWDCNWGFGPPEDAVFPENNTPLVDKTTCQSEIDGSIIGCESRTLAEEIPIAGTPFSLRYQSNRTPGYLTQVSIPLGNKPTPNSLRRVEVLVEVGGRRDVYPYVLPYNRTILWNWDGLDPYGRKLRGPQQAKIRVGYVYGGVTDSTAQFGAIGSASITGNRMERTVTLWAQPFTTTLEAFDASEPQLGGWTLSAQHSFATPDTLHRGDGSAEQVNAGSTYIVEHYAGVTSGASAPDSNNFGPAATANIHSYPSGAIIAEEDGSIVIGINTNTSSGNDGRIRRISKDGTIATIAGSNTGAAKYDGIPALQAVVRPWALAKGPDGAIYFAEHNQHQIWKLVEGNPSTLRHVAGTGQYDIGCTLQANCGDGGDAKFASVTHPQGLVFTRDGSLFIKQLSSSSVRKHLRVLSPDGIISSVSMTSQQSAFWFNNVTSIAPTLDGHLVSSRMMVRVLSNGTIEPLAKRPDGNPLDVSTDICTSQHGVWYQGIGLTETKPGRFITICSDGNFQEVQPDGSKLRVAGPPFYSSGYAGNDGPALAARFHQAGPSARTPDGGIVFWDQSLRLLRRFKKRDVFNGAEYVVHGKSTDELYEFNLNGRHSRTVDARTSQPIYTFGYGSPTSQAVETITDQYGQVTNIARNGNTITITAPRGHATTLTLDANGYLASVTDPNGDTKTTVHNEKGLLTDYVDARGKPHHFVYTAAGRLKKDTNALPGSPGLELSSVSHVGNWTVTLTSAEGRTKTTRVKRDDLGSDITERRIQTDGAGLVTTIDHRVDGTSNVTSPDNTKRTVLATASDPRFGKLSSFVSSSRVDVGAPNTSHSFTRNETRTAMLTTPADPFSATSETRTTTVTAAGEPNAVSTRVWNAGPPATWTSTSPEGRVVQATMDAHNRIAALTVLGTTPVALAPVQFAYGPTGNLEGTLQGTRVSSRSYNAATGFLTGTSNPWGQIVTYSNHDGVGRPRTVTLPGNRTLALAFDASGNLTSVTPPGRTAHGFAPNEQDALSLYSPPAAPNAVPKDTSYLYDYDGLLKAKLQPEKPAHYGYDGAARLVAATNASTLKTFQYDALGHVAGIRSSNGVELSFTYNGALLTQESVSGPFAHTLGYTYDNLLRVRSQTLGASTVAFSYDRDDLLVGNGPITLNWGNTGLLQSVSVEHGGGDVDELYSYNAYGEVIGVTASGVPGAYSAVLDREAGGRLHEKTETLGGLSHSTRYDYDAAGRLSAVYLDGAVVPARSYSYDANGNRDGGLYDAQDRLTHWGTSTYAYGPNGELESHDDGNGATLYTYDAAGNLRHVQRPPVLGAPLPAIDYVVDGLNRRIGKKVGGVLERGWLYQGGRIVAELDATGAVVSRFLYASRGHSPDVMLRGGVTYRLIADHLGSIRQVIDVTNGMVVEETSYDEWGVPDAASAWHPFGFAGGLYDADTGFVRFGARDYDPRIGRWTSKDASRFAGGLNLYGYANNDPVNFIDLTGYTPEGMAKGAAIGATLGAGFGYMYGAAAGVGITIGTGGAGFATIPVGGYLGGAGGALIGAGLGGIIGDLVTDALESKKWDGREGDGTRGLSPDEVRDKYRDLGWSRGEIEKLIQQIEKFRGQRNKQKRNRTPVGPDGPIGIGCWNDDDD